MSGIRVLALSYFRFIFLHVRPPHHSPITRLSARPQDTTGQVPTAIVGPRPKFPRQPYPDTTVNVVRRLVEETTLTYREIEKKTGVPGPLACFWKRDQGWQRPPFAARSTDNVPLERASARLRRRWLGYRISALAERAVRELEASASIDLDKLAEAVELFKLAKLAAGPRKRNAVAAANESQDRPPRFDAEPLEVMRALRAAGVRMDIVPEQALVDFVISRAPPPPRLTKRQREHKRMMEKE